MGDKQIYPFTIVHTASSLSGDGATSSSAPFTSAARFPLTTHYSINANYHFDRLRSPHENQEINHQIDQQILFLQWLRNIWSNYVKTEYQGWDGTLMNLQDEMIENYLEIKSSYVLCLELYYHLRNISITNDNEETRFFRTFLELILSEGMDEIALEHYSMLGLYFYLRRTMSYEGFQFLGSLPPTIRSDCMSSGDICRDFIHAVDAYFATQIVWKVIGISSQGSLLALSSKYEELMEMYFRIKCYLSNGLIKSSSSFGPCNWFKVYEYIQDIFQTIHSQLPQSNDSPQVSDPSQNQSNDEVTASTD